MTRRLLVWGGAAALVVGAIVWAAWPSAGAATPASRAHELATELRCPDCQALSVADSDSSSAEAIRADLLRRTKAGESDTEIRQVYIDRYGESILLKPTSTGLGLLVWVLPVVALALGAVGLGLAFAKWRGQPRLRATDADEALVEQARAG
ncbi:MAG TPA: cytochrome c-type biogenesis protein [Acidimicrobiia bacterium]|nr:cytochrome c-type biogenesis protein [Acidimicrobiia bacterium]